MKKLTLLLSAVVIGLAAKAQSFTATYTFDSVSTTTGTTDPTPLPSATGISFGSFTSTGASANPNAAGRFSFTGWPTGATASSDVYATHTGTINTAEYYSVTIAPNASYAVSLSGIAFRVQRSGTGIRTYAVRSSRDGYAANLPASISPANANLSVQPGDIFYWNFDATTSGQNGSMITLSGPAFTNISSPVTFRFYGWNSEASGGTFSIDNVAITGVATALTGAFTFTTACLGNATTFTDSSFGPYPITGYGWDFGDGSPMATTMNATHLYATPGTYAVIHTVTDSTGNSNAHTELVAVNPNPVAGISSNTLFCANTVAQFLDASSITSGSITGYSWNFGEPSSGTADTSTIQNPQHIYTMPGLHPVTEIVTSNLGCKDTASVNITVDSVGAAYTSSVAGSVVSFNGTAFGGSPAYTFAWTFGDGNNSTMPSPVHTYAAPGSYTACLTVMDMNGCSDSTCSNFIIVSTGIADHQAAEFSIVPNPSNDGVFRFKAEGRSSVVTVYNMVGSVVFSKEFNGSAVIDLSSQPEGTYFVRVQTAEQSSVKKLIISK